MKALIEEKKDYQQYFIQKLVEAGYRERITKEKYDMRFAFDAEELLAFLGDTQPEQMEQLRKIHGDKANDLILAQINNQIISGGLIECLKNGVEVNSIKLNLLYFAPATSFNPTQTELYNKNRFTVMQEVAISDTERIDLVMFLNGIAIVSCELKCGFSGQTFRNAIHQYSYDRDPNNRLFKFKAGTIVNFAMDLNDVWMTTRLNGGNTTFLPFNRGQGEGVNSGAGNPLEDGVDDYPVHYIWDDVLTPASLIEIITKFAYVHREEKTDPETGRKNLSETIIFPRYHQRDAVRKLLEDVKNNKSNFNYLIEHSAGSGKTNTICWLAHRLSSLHDNEDKQIFDNILIVTDRLVVDQQLQNAVKAIDHQPGLIRAIGEEAGDNSATLQDALRSNTKIIATTIQKFLHLDFSEFAKEMSSRRYAVIIDEAHSSTSGKNMAAVHEALKATQDEAQQKETAEDEAVDVIEDKLVGGGKQPNVSVFAFTATPKTTTLQLFGTDFVTEDGSIRKKAFHLYSMKQAIEEGFILDVLRNYTEYNTYFKTIKKSEDDPELKTKNAMKQIYEVAMMSPENIEQRIAIILAHFRDSVKKELGGSAKAMIVTTWREEAAEYYFAIQKYLKDHNITDVRPLVAFTGKVKVHGEEFTEPKINGFSEDKLPDEFNTDKYNLLIVANKYQVGFDQKKLCAMYVLKSLKGVNAVQTLSRLNRICKPFDKKTFVLDFVNTYAEMEQSFAPFYTTTILQNTATITQLRDLSVTIDGYRVITDYDIDVFYKVVNEAAVKEVRGTTTAQTKIKDNAMANQLVQRTIQVMENMYRDEPDKKRNFIQACRSYVRLYEFLSLILSNFDTDLVRRYLFISVMLKNIDTGTEGGIDIRNKISMVEFKNAYQDQHNSSNHPANPFVNLPTAQVSLSKDEKKLLSEIIEDINAITGQAFDVDVATKSMLQIKDLLLKNPELKTSAKNNNENDFAFSFYDNADAALLDGLVGNNEFFTQLLNNEKLKAKVLDAFKHSVYKNLRNEGG